MAARHFTDTCDRICLLLYQSAGAEYPFSRLLVFCDPDGICIRNRSAPSGKAGMFPSGKRGWISKKEQWVLTGICFIWAAYFC